MNLKFQISNFQFPIILIFIVIIASFLRLYNLSFVPPSASMDEASIGYNAYSILKTGNDEYGYRFPLLLRAYDDWRPALYVYFVIPFIKLFGLNVFSVRLPSVILSILTVIATYYLARKLFPKAYNFSIFSGKAGQFSISEVATLLLAISPWHIYLSRLGHEANMGLAFFILGITFFVYRKIYLSFILFALSFASYQSEKVVIPLFIILILFLFRKELIKIKKQFVIASLLAVIILMPFVKETMSPNALVRFKATNAFSSQQERFINRTKLLAQAVEENNSVGKIIYNRRILAGQIFLENYISHFNPVWLFNNLSNDRHKVPGIGLMYIWEAPLILFGIIFLFKQNLDKKIKILIISWVLISPLPAAITTDAPHAMRTYTMLPVPQLLAGLGFIQMILFLKRFKNLTNYASNIFFTVLFFLILISLWSFYKQYFFVFPKTQSDSFQYALSTAIPFVLDNEESYNKIVISNKDNLYQSYMFYLFYSSFDPVLYQAWGGTKSGGFAEKHTIGKYEFRLINQESLKERILYMGNVQEFSEDDKPIKIFNNMDSKGVIKAVKK